MKGVIYLILSVIVLLGLKTNENVLNHIDKSLENIDCDLLPRVRTNAPSSFSISEIDSLDYKPETFRDSYKLTLFSNSDSIEKIYNENYPEIFRKTDKGYQFKSFGGSDIIVENNLEQEKSYSKYEFKAKYKDYVILFINYFEGWQSILINLKSGYAFTLLDKPHFITDNVVYSYTNYYGDADISIYNIEKRESIDLSFQNLDIVDSYNLADHIMFKAICPNSRETKYFQLLNYR